MFCEKGDLEVVINDPEYPCIAIYTFSVYM